MRMWAAPRGGDGLGESPGSAWRAGLAAVTLQSLCKFFPECLPPLSFFQVLDQIARWLARVERLHGPRERHDRAPPILLGNQSLDPCTTQHHAACVVRDLHLYAAGAAGNNYRKSGAAQPDIEPTAGKELTALRGRGIRSVTMIDSAQKVKCCCIDRNLAIHGRNQHLIKDR